MAFFDGVTVVVLGGGDLASGVIYRLHRAGFPVVVTELAKPLFVRRTVAYGEAVYSGTITVDGVPATRAETLDGVTGILARGTVPVLVDPTQAALAQLVPTVIVDARMEKRNLGISRGAAPLVIALGPGFVAGDDVHAVVETNRGHYLGRVIWEGAAEPDTGQPGGVNGKTKSRVLRAPATGNVNPHVAIGELVREDDPVAEIGGEVVRAPFDGVVRGLIHPTVTVPVGMKIGDIDPRGDVSACYAISEKSLAVGGGVLEAVLASSAVREAIRERNETTAGL